jgi:hypothetical protein
MLLDARKVIVRSEAVFTLTSAWKRIEPSSPPVEEFKTYWLSRVTFRAFSSVAKADAFITDAVAVLANQTPLTKLPLELLPVVMVIWDATV